MKKTLAVLTLLAGAVSGYSQGQVYMGDYGNSDFQITVWSPQVATPTVEVTGNTAANNSLTGTSDIPAGTATYTGVPIGGAATGATSPTDYANANLWSVQLYAAAGSGVAASSLTPVGGTIANFYTNPSQVGYPGQYDSTAVVTFGGATGNPGAPTVAAGSPVTLAIGAWYNGNGAFASLAAAKTAGMPTGMSTTGSENATGAPNTPPDLPAPGAPQTLAGGITSFSLVTSTITPVPEPSTIALGLVGASAFLMRLRRK
jgi:hypothetical protein